MQQLQQVRTVECFLCYEQTSTIGIGKCNHTPMCYRCIYKMRELSNNNQCPLCLAENTVTIITSDLDKKFEQYNLQDLLLWDEKWGLYTTSKGCEDSLNQLKLYQCFFQECQQKSVFQNINFLKKHLFEKHARYLCDLCVENKLCIISEHVLYTKEELNKHLKVGDYDQMGNIQFFHPRCAFCGKNYYDEEKFYKHMQQEHLTCHICGYEFRFIFYENYQKLESHYKISHYICDDEQCRKKGNVAFRTQQEKEMHHQKVHREGGLDEDQKQKINLVNIDNYLFMEMAGFHYGEQIQNKQQLKQKRKEEMIKDEEGKDLELQFISQRRIKQKLTKIASHEDQKLDIRDFLNHQYNQQEIDNIINQFYSFITQKNQDDQGGNQRGGKGRGRGGRGGKGNCVQYMDKSKKSLDPQEIPIQEEVKIYKFQDLPSYDINQFDQLIEKFAVNDDVLSEYYNVQDEIFSPKKKITPKEFFDIFMKVVGKNLGIRIFGLFISTIEKKYENVKQELDNTLLDEYLALPKKNETILNTSEKYSDFFKKFRDEIEKNITYRIENKILNLHEKQKMDRERIFQLIEILRRVNTQEMAKLKYSANFGVSVDTIDLITNHVYYANLKDIQEMLTKIPNQEFIHLYLYVTYSDDLIQGRKIYEEKSKLSKLLLKPYFIRYPENVRKFSNAQQHVDESGSDNDSNSKQQDYTIASKLEESKSQNASQYKQQNFDIKDKYEFPSFQNQGQVKQLQKKIDSTGAGSKWQERKDIYNLNNEEEKKQLEDEFPTLISKSTSKKEEEIIKISQEQYEQQQKKVESYDNEVLNKNSTVKQIGVKKGKKGQKLILIDGNFK